MVIRAVATADNHLSGIYGRMTPQKLAKRRKYLRDGFKSTVEYALKIHARLFLIAGDLFDSPDPRNVDRAFVAHCFAQLHQEGITICAIGGNHDTLHSSTDQGGTSPLDIYCQLGAITVFETSARISDTVVEIGDLRIAVGGMTPHPAAEWGSDPLADTSWRKSERNADTSILLLHGQVEGHTLPDAHGAVFALASLREATDADVILMGNIHRSATIPIGPGRTVIVPGSTERMTFGEAPDVPGFMVLEYAPGQGWHAERILLPGQPRLEMTLRTEQLPEAELAAFIVEQVMQTATQETLVKLTIQGFMPRERYHLLNVRSIIEQLQSRVFHTTIDTNGIILEDHQQRSAQRGVRLSQQDELRVYAAELKANATLEEQALVEAALQRILAHYGSSEEPV